MSARTKRILTAVLVLALLCGVVYAVFGNPAVRWHNFRLHRAVSAVQGDTVTLEELVPFAWDAVYTFAPYTTKEEIEAVVGFSSRELRPNWINEGMVHLIFTRKNHVAACILAYPQGLGWNISFTGRIPYGEQISFAVSRTEYGMLLEAAP